MLSRMSKPIFVVSIAKNEEKYVKTWAESAKGADGVFLLDTGSTDNTIEVAKSLGCKVDARSASMGENIAGGAWQLLSADS
jgi:glycosyltransferase involved in cell wall biosynthesis